MFNCVYNISILLLVFVLGACGSQLDTELDQKSHEQVPGGPQIGQDALVTVFKADQFPIACYYFDPNSPDYGQGVLKKSAWVWAKVKGYDHVAATGKMQDGFLVADRIEAVDWLHSTKMVTLTMDGVERICQSSIDTEYPGRGLKLYKYVAFKTRLPGASKYPIVIRAEEQRKINKLTRLLVFGDSLSDVGRLLSSLKVFPNAPYFLGRFSNGPIWSDVISTTANLSVQNRAKGGAVTDPNIDFNLSEVIGMVRDRGRGLVTGSTLKTIRDYLANKTKNKQIEDPDRTLIMLWVGGNDYVAKFDTKDDMTTLINEPEALKKGGKWVARFSVRNILDQLRVLYIAGGRHFLVGNLPNMGTIPAISENKTYVAPHLSDMERTYHLSAKMTEISQYHNQVLKKGLEDLQNELPDANFILFDAYNALQNIIAGIGPDGQENFAWKLDTEKSFTNLYAPGKLPIKVGKRCYTGTYLGTDDTSKICKDSREVLFWDDVHPTAKGHCSVAFMMHRQLYKNGYIATPPNFDDYQELCRLNFAR